MARNSGSPEDPGDYPDSEPTRYADYSGTGGTGGEAYSEYGAQDFQEPTGYGRYPVQESPPWFQRPAALVGLGALTAVVLAFLVYAAVKFTDSGTSPGPAGTSTSVAPTIAPVPGPTEQPVPAPTTAEPSAVVPAPPQTTTIPPTAPTTTAPTTTAPTTTATETTPSPTETVTTSVTTVTETTTRRRFPNLPTRLVPPTLYEPPPGG